MDELLTPDEAAAFRHNTERELGMLQAHLAHTEQLLETAREGFAQSNDLLVQAELAFGVALDRVAEQLGDAQREQLHAHITALRSLFPHCIGLARDTGSGEASVLNLSEQTQRQRSEIERVRTVARSMGAL
jgi:hypothetical protein